ncbi:hypothetical protein TRFO_38933 [Tritrichomonas foetus]|uniref:Initiator binding domain-containing protein n=1 Tax=Tritrichomonas foetus TaxID=1144522 RepID=A0A1J4J6Q5_9EUKA|nr:hypothetical protein TRFO_38933 [Tritrichomonas foetus]|eukprot:OHS94914.1 hypothetical protein TRFO_38933 [Tritrichomonas foetus]
MSKYHNSSEKKNIQNMTNMRGQDAPLPSTYWNKLSSEDKIEFQKLRTNFHRSQKISSKDPRLVSFSNELHTILKFIEHDESGRENRTVLAGVAFAGPFICVNTRSLKSFLGRCKSSINGSFQQLGYVAIKTKSKARSCVLAILPTLINDQNILRQWTVRCASEDAKFCFATSLTSLQLPIINEDDLNDDHRGNRAGLPLRNISAAPPLSVSTLSSSLQTSLNSSLQSTLQSLQQMMPLNSSSQPLNDISNDAMEGFTPGWQNDMMGEMSTSYSVDCFAAISENANDPIDYALNWNPMYEQKSMTRSQSAMNFASEPDGSFFSMDFSMF